MTRFFLNKARGTHLRRALRHHSLSQLGLTGAMLPELLEGPTPSCRNSTCLPLPSPCTHPGEATVSKPRKALPEGLTNSWAAGRQPKPSSDQALQNQASPSQPSPRWHTAPPTDQGQPSGKTSSPCPISVDNCPGVWHTQKLLTLESAAVFTALDTPEST